MPPDAPDAITPPASTAAPTAPPAITPAGSGSTPTAPAAISPAGSAVNPEAPLPVTPSQPPAVPSIIDAGPPSTGLVILQMRRGTAAQWTSANPVLASGEQGLETDTRKTKIGDGSTAWNSLAYQITPESLLALLAGQTLELDGFTVADFAGLEIPANTYGQKSGVPFYGDFPLSETIESGFTMLQCPALITGTGLISAHVGSYAVSAADAVNGRSFAAIVRMELDGTAGSTVPHANDKFYLMARMGLGTPVFTSGAWLEITPSNIVETQTFLLNITIDAQGSSPFNIKPSFTVSTVERVSAADKVSNGVIRPMHTPVLSNPLVFLNAPGVATSLEFYLVVIADQGDFAAYDISGSVQIYRKAAISTALA